MQGKPPLKRVVERMIEERVHATLLAVCPNSDAVTRAAVRSAVTNDAPLLFAATLNQVDTDGGYTGWTPDALMKVIRASLASSDPPGEPAAAVPDPGALPVFVGLDHAGPWTKDQYFSDALPVETALTRARESIAACLAAGYALIHVDTTIDPAIEGLVPVPVMVERTVSLIAFAEEQRLALELPPIAYEVGTEEVRTPGDDVERFRRFVSSLADALATANLMHAWPSFFVGALGTELHTTRFDEATATQLAAIARAHGSAVKGHYTDYVENPTRYPAARIGGANVGPEFADVELAALRALTAIEQKLNRNSWFEAVLSGAVIKSDRWRKWLTEEERGAASFDMLTRERREWLIGTGSRYVWTEDEVVEARRRLYDNVAGEVDPDEYVVNAIARRIDHYQHAFNLVGLAPRVQAWTAEGKGE